MIYKLKQKNEDFMVSEVFMPIFGEGDYSLYLLQKKGIRTVDTVDCIANILNISSEMISYAGLKDEDAVTTQYITIRGGEFGNVFHESECGNFTLKFIGSTPNPMEIGQIYGNAFKVKVRGLSYENALKLSKLKKHEVEILNYYDIQRFGMPNSLKIAHYIGKSIIDRDYSEMLSLLLKSNNISISEYMTYKENEINYFHNSDIRKINFFLSAWDSFLWNKQLQNSIVNYTSEYEVVKREGIDFVYCKIDDKLKQILCDDEIIRHNISKDGIITEKISYRNPLMHTIISATDMGVDLLNDGCYYADISFMLPSGSYATALIDQCIHMSPMNTSSDI